MLQKCLCTCLILTAYVHLAWSIPLNNGEGCITSRGEIFQQPKRNKDGTPVLKEGLPIYEGAFSLTTQSGICFQTTYSGEGCWIEGKNKKYKNVYISIVECPVNSTIIPLIVVVLLGTIFYRFLLKKQYRF